MRRAIPVGMGFGKRDFHDAVLSATANDVLVLDPGEYRVDGGFDTGKLAIRGAGNNPSDVVIYTHFNVKNGGVLNLENVTVINPSEKGRTCLVPEGGQLIAKRVVFSSQSENGWAVIGAKGGNVGLTACEVKHTDPETMGLIVSEGGYALISQCDITYLKCVGGKVDSQNSQISSNLWITEHGEFNGDTVYFGSKYDNWYAFVVSDGSVLNIEGLVLPEDDLSGSVVNSRFNAPQTNIGGTVTLTIRSEGSNDINVTGAEVQEIQVDGGAGEAATGGDDEAEDEDVNGSEGEAEEEATEGTDPEGEAEEVETKKAIDQLHEMIGLTGLKKQVDSFIKLAAFTKLRAAQGAKTTSQSLHSLFLGNPGTGKTTVARLVAKAMFENGVIPKDNYVEVSRKDLVAEHVGGTALKTQKVLDSATGGVLFIDEAYTLFQSGGSNWGQEAVDTILKYMEDHRDDLMIIFAGYTKEMQDFMNMNPGLTSRAPNVFTFEDYTPEEIAKIGVLNMRGQQFNFDEDYYSRAVIKAFKADVDHSNGRWVRNFNEQLVRVVAESAMENPDRDLNTVTNEDIDEMTGGSEDVKAQRVEELLAELNGMVGLDSVKSFVTDLVERVKVDRLLADKLGDSARPTYHMVFAGAPGTGKTTVARIIAELFFNLGILPKSTVSEVTRADLVGPYIGHTEERTATAIRNAMGGVLFVDEAYQLTQGGSNDFGKQAVETFITELENNRDKFVAIFAGYTEDMDRFLEANAGLRSRIPLTLTFDPYTPDEVATIVLNIIQKKWTVNEKLLLSIVANRYKQLPEAEQSNGRWARNFADQIVTHHKLWLSDHLDDADLDMKHIQDDLLFDSMSW